MRRKSERQSKVKVVGLFRGQLVDPKTGKVCGDTGWVKNKLTNAGLTQLALLIGGGAGGYAVTYMAAGTQASAVDMSQTDLVGRTHSFVTAAPTTSGTCTATFTVDFGSASLSASCSVGAVGLYKTNSAGSLIACQTFATSQWNTNQDFNVTYQLRFATA
jgi:hypothetical protein